MTEILNIEYHTRRLILKALNATKTKDQAAEALGMSVRKLYMVCKQYEIRWDTRAIAYVSGQVLEGEKQGI